MAFANHYRVSFGGKLAEAFVDDEIWNCNVNLVDQTHGGENFDPDAYLADIAPQLATWYSSADAGNSNQATLEYVKCNEIGPDGKYVDPTGSHTYDYSPVVRGNAAPIYPQIISTCISWASAKSRGPGAHGRIYPPNNTFAPANVLEMALADQQGLVRAGIVLLGALNNTGEAARTLVPVIASKVDASNSVIVEVKVGSRKDVQRRRADQIRETYVVAPFISQG